MFNRSHSIAFDRLLIPVRADDARGCAPEMAAIGDIRSGISSAMHAHRDVRDTIIRQRAVPMLSKCRHEDSVQSLSERASRGSDIVRGNESK